MKLSSQLAHLTWSLALCGALAAPAAANETGLGGAPYWSVKAPGADFYQVSTTTRSSFIPNPQTNPFTATMPAPPAGTQIVEVFALWNYNLDGSAPAFDVVGINGNPVSGTLVGQGSPDLGWLRDRTVTFIASGVGQYLNFGALNTISGACDKALGSDPNALGAGMTILVVHRTLHGTEKRVSVWAGYSSTESSSSGNAEAILSLPTPYPGGEAHLFLNALDGFSFNSDTFEVNGSNAGGVLAGTSASDNAWKGLKGPGSLNSIYDCVDDDARDFMSAGDVELRARSLPTSPGTFTYDTLAHSFAALTTIESCGNWVGYCTAKVNSQGCTPVIAASGTPSAGASTAPFHVGVNNIVNNVNGLMFYGYDKQSLPFQGGTLCVVPPVQRTSLQNSGGSPTGVDCSGSMKFDFNAYVASGVDPLLVPGVTVFAQYWTRDPADPFGSNLSAGICFDLCQ